MKFDILKHSTINPHIPADISALNLRVVASKPEITETPTINIDLVRCTKDLWQTAVLVKREREGKGWQDLIFRESLLNRRTSSVLRFDVTHY